MTGVTKALVAASVVLGLSYVLADASGASGLAAVLWKRLPVALLAAAALVAARGRDGWLLALALALGALGDVLLIGSMTQGALAFMAAHIAAIVLYLRNRRPSLTGSQRALALLLVPAVALIAFLLPTDRGEAAGVAFYALFVATMAAAAWTSRFPRYRVGIGAMLMVASDLLIFAEMGPLDEGSAGPAIWLSYYLGQLLVFLGVTGTLRAADDDLHHRL